MRANISLYVLRAWSRRGQRAYCSVPRNRGPNTTLLSSMSMEGMGPSLAVEGATTATVFEAYVEKALAPTLPVNVFSMFVVVCSMRESTTPDISSPQLHWFVPAAKTQAPLGALYMDEFE